MVNNLKLVFLNFKTNWYSVKLAYLNNDVSLNFEIQKFFFSENKKKKTWLTLWRINGFKLPTKIFQVVIVNYGSVKSCLMKLVSSRKFMCETFRQNIWSRFWKKVNININWKWATEIKQILNPSDRKSIWFPSFLINIVNSNLPLL